jgi:hypothetical protein
MVAGATRLIRGLTANRAQAQEHDASKPCSGSDRAAVDHQPSLL